MNKVVTILVSAGMLLGLTSFSLAKPMHAKTPVRHHHRVRHAATHVSNTAARRASSKATLNGDYNQYKAAYGSANRHTSGSTTTNTVSTNDSNRDNNRMNSGSGATGAPGTNSVPMRRRHSVTPPGVITNNGQSAAGTGAR